jgi:4-methyl-5(b-hydroxyethyl)-thiazole monophosphate biosynthesis
MPSVLVPLAQGCEELEAVTIIDLLRRAKIDVVSASLDDQPVKASRGVVLLADMTLDEALQQDYDMVVLPGGAAGADRLNADVRIQSLVKKMYADGKFTAAICAAPKVLATAGLLDDKSATSYPGALAKVDNPLINIIDAPVIKDGQVVTSRGPGTAMDFALTLIECLRDLKTRQKVETALARDTE